LHFEESGKLFTFVTVINERITTISKTQKKRIMSFQLPALPYGFDALEPHIDARTMEIHHGKHHAAYTNNLNAAIQGTELEGKTIEEILAHISTHSPAIRNNGGGFYNHNLFWTILSPNGSPEPAASLAIHGAILADLGSFETFHKDFAAAGATRFGSGWAWLAVDAAGKLFISSSPNQDNPLMDVAEKKGTPVLGLDVWEHAYYLNYQNRRPDYIESFFSIINWEEVNKRYLAAKG
jgi:Fe-Mn family superoxide dismutase